MNYHGRQVERKGVTSGENPRSFTLCRECFQHELDRSSDSPDTIAVKWLQQCTGNVSQGRIEFTDNEIPLMLLIQQVMIVGWQIFVHVE